MELLAQNYGHQLPVSIGHDSSLIAVGRSNGFEVFTIIDGQNVRRVCLMECGPLRLISLHYSTPLVFAVPMQSKNSLIILNIYKNKKICRIQFEKEIKFIASNNFHFVVCTTNHIKIYHILHTTSMWEIRYRSTIPIDTSALSTSPDYTRFAYQLKPARLNIKHISIINADVELHLPFDIVSALAFNDDATLICVASRGEEKIHIFSADSGAAIHAFDLGRTMTPCTISQLCFDGVNVLVSGYTPSQCNRAALYRVRALKDIKTAAHEAKVEGDATELSLTGAISEWGADLLWRGSSQLMSFFPTQNRPGDGPFDLSETLADNVEVRFWMKTKSEFKFTAVSLDKGHLVLYGIDCENMKCPRYYTKQFHLSRVDAVPGY